MEASSERTTSAMEGNHDRISELPDPSLVHILSAMATKLAISPAVTLDFTGEFARRQTPDELVASINRHLQLYTGHKIRGFRVSLHPAKLYQEHLDRWVQFAATRLVEELDLNFSPPAEEMGYYYPDDDGNSKPKYEIPTCLYSSGSLTHLSLSFCDLCSPWVFSNFGLLQSLSLRGVNFDDATLGRVLSGCPLLEMLSLRQCSHLNSVDITSPTTRLKRLVLVDCEFSDDFDVVRISAPSVESFHFFGDIYCIDFSLAGAPSLSDAFICYINRECTEPEHDYVKLLSELAHVRILTVCKATLMCVTILEEYYMEEDDLPLQLESLQELKLLMPIMDAEYLSYIYGFLRLFPSPFLEKLFIRLPKVLEDPTRPYQVPNTRS
uniref:F-box protein At5g03100 n=1 Tax=Anthurium amnicola TaxID=1678845 RepID=A0A1D1XCT0_9ARAE